MREYVDDGLDPGVVENIEAHLRGCPNCERFGASFGEMVIALRKEAMTGHPMSHDAMSRLLEGLRNSMSER